MNSNPYVEARREWDERYADLVLGKRNWQITAGGLLLLSLILAAGVVWQSTRSRFIPYVVEVDKLGYGITVPKPFIPSTDPALVDRMERYEVASFIRSSRSVSSDPSAEQNMLNDMLAHAKGAADKYLDEYFHSENFAHNPFKKAEHQTISVQIDSILELPPPSSVLAKFPFFRNSGRVFPGSDASRTGPLHGDKAAIRHPVRAIG